MEELAITVIAVMAVGFSAFLLWYAIDSIERRKQ